MFKEIPILIRTTHFDTELLNRLDWFVKQPGCNWILTQGGVGDLAELTITRGGVFLSNGTEQLSFHPSMALIRLINLQRGGTDRFLEATQLKAGGSLIDGTLGLGTDALIGAWAVGEQGKILAIEKSPILAAIVKDGLKNFKEIIPNTISKHKQEAWLAMERVSQQIEVCWGEHRKYLANVPTNSVDVVYFDPMFRQTYQMSHSILPLHKWSDHCKLNHEAILEACRVARYRVVLKERKNSPEFRRLGFDILIGGHYSAVDYGVILV